jgi:hypothetical protein
MSTGQNTGFSGIHPWLRNQLSIKGTTLISRYESEVASNTETEQHETKNHTNKDVAIQFSMKHSYTPNIII